MLSICHAVVLPGSRQLYHAHSTNACHILTHSHVAMIQIASLLALQVRAAAPAHNLPMMNNGCLQGTILKRCWHDSPADAAQRDIEVSSCLYCQQIKRPQITTTFPSLEKVAGTFLTLPTASKACLADVPALVSAHSTTFFGGFQKDAIDMYLV